MDEYKIIIKKGCYTNDRYYKEFNIYMNIQQ